MTDEIFGATQESEDGVENKPKKRTTRVRKVANSDSSESVETPKRRGRKSVSEVKDVSQLSEKAELNKEQTFFEHVPHDRPVEWIVPKDTDNGEPIVLNRAERVLPTDDSTVLHASDIVDKEINNACVQSNDNDVDDTQVKHMHMQNHRNRWREERNNRMQERRFANQQNNQQNNQNTNSQSADVVANQDGVRQPQELFNNNNNAQDRFNQRNMNNRRMSRRERQRLRKMERNNQLNPTDANMQPQQELPPINVTELQRLSVEALSALAEEKGITDDLPSLWKHDIVYALLRNHVKNGGSVIAEGVLELLQDGNGYLRNEWNSFKSCPEDAFVTQQMVRKLGLRPGDIVVGETRAPMRDQKEKRFTVTNVTQVNGMIPSEARRVHAFESLLPTFPTRKINLETTTDQVEMRIVDLFTPIGFGQRGLIVAPPRTGKTVLMQKMANAISTNHPDAELIILLIDERPEEVTDMIRNTKAKVYSSTFDESPECHVQVANVVIERARRMVEQGKDVIIMLDSITRLARAFNTVQPHSGKILTGGVDANALQKPKRFFGSARNIEEGGSLTIIATALVDTGSKMDEVIFEEFKGTGNMELCLDRQLSDRRIFPAINILTSGTRKEDELVNKDALERIWTLRKTIANTEKDAAMLHVLKRMNTTENNIMFLLGLNL